MLNSLKNYCFKTKQFFKSFMQNSSSFLSQGVSLNSFPFGDEAPVVGLCSTGNSCMSLENKKFQQWKILEGRERIRLRMVGEKPFIFQSVAEPHFFPPGFSALHKDAPISHLPVLYLARQFFWSSQPTSPTSCVYLCFFLFLLRFG